MTTAYNELSGRDLERLKTLADGVFAVAMTLLVLDLRLPGRVGSNHDLWSALGDMGPQLAAYALSFTMLGTFWLAEHTLLPAVREAGPDAVILADGMSCRVQLADLAGVRALHLAELLAGAPARFDPPSGTR